MKIINKDWFDFLGLENYVLLWTSNVTLTSHGTAVMGRGLAHAIADKYPTVKKLEAKALQDTTDELKIVQDKYDNYCSIRIPHVHSVARIHGTLVGAFPVKYGWWEPADLKIIRKSAQQLARLIDQETITGTVVCNFPGIGAGKLGHQFYDIKNMLQEVLGERDVIFVLRPKKGASAPSSVQ